MNKKDRVVFISNYLEKLYPNTPIPLSHSNNYELLIAVLLSAQCTDERVNQVTPILFSKANKPDAMITLNVEEIYDIIRPCGLAPKKSKAIWDLSLILVEKYNSKVPENFGKLIERISDNTISGKIAKSVLEEIWENGSDVDEIIKSKGLVQIQDESLLEEIAKKVIDSNPDQVAAYKGGKDKLFGFFVGQVMKETQGKANPKSVNDILKKFLD